MAAAIEDAVAALEEKPPVDPEPEPPVDEKVEVTRIFGANRYETAYRVADVLKHKLGVDLFDAVVVATGEDFADALAGSYLAAVKNAPILLVKEKAEYVEMLHEYIRENLEPDGTIYILGGEAVVPESVQNIDGYVVKRLAGNNRYETNIKILKEAGITGNEIIVATGKAYADSLSASATGLPILLINPKKSLNDDQKTIADQAEKIYVVGGEDAVNEEIEASLAILSPVERVAGEDRYKTSVAVAKTFFGTVENAVVASGKNFPDGLCGGPLAAAMNAPLILTADGKTETAAGYMAENGIASGFVLGGTGAILDDSVKEVFGTDVNMVE